MALLLLLSGMALTSCTVPQEPLVKVEYRSPTVSPQLLKCQPRPLPNGEIETQVDLMDQLARVDKAGEDCRQKLDSVAKILSEP